MIRHSISTFAVLLAAFAVSGRAHAAQRHLSIPASQLGIDSPCAREVIIEPDPAAHGSVTVEATADHDEEIDELVLSGGSEPKLRGPEQCWRPPFALDFRSSMVIKVRVPPQIAVSIDESSAADYRLGAIGGRLALQLSGRVQVSAGNVTALEADDSGAGAITIAHATGSLHAELSGTAGISVDNGDFSAADVDMSGSGGLRVENGTIATLKLSISGDADATVGATVGDASVDLSGSGKLAIAKLTGTLQKNVSGSGDVIIGTK